MFEAGNLCVMMGGDLGSFGLSSAFKVKSVLREHDYRQTKHLIYC